MDAPNRSVIAYIAGLLITGADCWWIQDHDRRRRVHFEASFEPGSVKVYSHELGCHVLGIGAEGKYLLLQHGSGAAVDLFINLEEHTFCGCEHTSGQHFVGNVDDCAIHLYDYQDLRWHLYSL